MIISKAEGHFFQEVGIDLKYECFFTYVACLKVGSAKGLHILVPTGRKKHM
jgi:hypothetical protein